MSQPQWASSTESTTDAVRKRVCKACDRCRLKKSKCDGSSPCSRCKADNTICVFGERKKSHDKVYPKGYVEMLEQQQSQLVSGLQEMYKRLIDGQSWSAPALPEANGHPLTHDILAALNLLESKHDGSGEMESFEEDVQKLQSRLLADGAPYVQRRGSISSESEPSQHGHSRAASHHTPTLAKTPLFKENFSLTPSPSPLPQSPVPRQRPSYPPAPQSPLHPNLPPANDPQFYQTKWASNFYAHDAAMRSKFAVQAPDVQDGIPDCESIMESPWDEQGAFDLNMNAMTSYPQQYLQNMQNMQDFGVTSLDPMELDLSKYIQVAT